MVIKISNKEVWVKLEGFDEGYEISNKGRIKSYKKYKDGRYLKFGLDKDGYYKLSLRRSGRDVTARVSRLVALHFIPNPKMSPVVNHINGIKTDNRVENLEWCDVQYNTQHGYDTGLNPKGGEHGNAQYWNVYLDGEILSCYSNSYEIMEALCTDNSKIVKCYNENRLLYGTFEIQRTDTLGDVNLNKQICDHDTVYKMATTFKVKDMRGNDIAYYKSGKELERCTGINNAMAHKLSQTEKPFDNKYFIQKIPQREYIFSPKEKQNINLN